MPVIVWVLLIDAAVETLVAGVALGWLVALTVANYFAVIGLWRTRQPWWARLRWRHQATIAVTVLFGLLAVTCWLPGGLDNGIRLVRQPTSAVLTVVTAVSIVLAVVSIVKLSFTPRLVRILIAGLGGYGLAALTLGLVRDTSYADLLRGASAPSVLPFYLRGAFVGAVVILPLGVAALALRAASRHRSAGTVRQLVAVAMTLVMALSTFERGALVSEPQTIRQMTEVVGSHRELSGGPLVAEVSTSGALDEAARRLDDAFSAIDQARRTLRDGANQVDAVVEQVGRDPEKLFGFVRDHSHFVPYRGVLRGGHGVLLDRLGNSLDRSLLLYTLLRAVGATTRLARGSLTESQAKQLLRVIRPFPDFETRTGPGTATDIVEAFLRESAMKSGGNITASADTVGDLRTRLRAATAKIRDRARRQGARIANAVERLTDAGDGEAEWIEAVRDHWWVQWQNGDRWLDLDPTTPDARPGVALAEPVTTATPADALDLGGDLMHAVEVRVVLNVWKRGRIAEVPVLTHRLIPAALVGQTIVFEQVPRDWPQDLDLRGPEGPQRFKDTLVAQTAWLPVLRVGSARIPGQAFDMSGEPSENAGASTPMQQGTGRLGSRIGDMLGGREPNDRTDGSRAPSRSSVVVGERIDYVIETPGQSPRTVRRVLFNILPPGLRVSSEIPRPDVNPPLHLERALGLLHQTYILPLGWEPSRSFVRDVVVDGMLKTRPAALSLIRSPGRLPTPEEVDALSDLGPSLRLYDLAIGRATARDEGIDAYVGRPNVFTFHRYFTTDEHRTVLAGEAVDIVANYVAARPGVDGFRTRIEQGVIDSAVEGVVASQCADDRPCAGRHNASDATAASSDLIVVKDIGDPVWRGLQLDDRVRVQIEADVSSGFVALVPVDASSSSIAADAGWWRVDPGTGETLGVGNRGWGQTDVESMLIFVGKAAVVSTLFATCLAVRASPTTNTSSGAFPGGNVYGCEVGRCGLTAAFGVTALFVDAMLAVLFALLSGLAGHLLPPCSSLA